MSADDRLLESLGLFTQTAKIMNRTLNKGELIDIALQESRAMSSCRSVGLCVQRREGGDCDFYLAHDRLKRHRFMPAVSLDADEMDPGAIVRIGEDDLLKKMFHEEIGEEVDSRLRFPFLRREIPVGYLDLLNPPGGLQENRHLMGVMSALADLFVIAWDNAELYEQMHMKSLQNDLLLETARMLSSSLDLNEVLSDMIRALKRVIDYDGVGIFLMKKGGARIEPRVWDGYFRPDSRERLSTKVGEGLVGWVIERGEGVYVPDTSADSRYVEARPETRSELVVPIKVGDKTIGAFNVESDRVDAYSEDDLDFLSVFASQASVSIERARLHKEILQNRRLEEQLNVARLIQSTFLPQDNPKVPGFQVAGINIPSQMVGGDYYDFIRIVDNQIGIAIADVSGKGMPASLIMASFRASLIAEIRNNYAIRTILQKVNRLLNESLDQGNFVTAVYGVLDSKNRILTFSNAGHNPPILLRSDGTTEELTEGGLALGIMEDQSYEERPVYIERGDIVVCFTDGVTEASNAKGELFEEERLMNILSSNREKSAEELVRLVVDAVNEFIDEDFEPDDLTLIVIKATE